MYFVYVAGSLCTFNLFTKKSKLFIQRSVTKIRRYINKLSFFFIKRLILQETCNIFVPASLYNFFKRYSINDFQNIFRKSESARC